MSTDAFGGGGHSRTADELVRTIQQMRSKGGTIGLEGIWGSGKSTVIKIASDRLKEKKFQRRCSVFTFDLWTYQSEDFRTALLRNLLEHLRNVFEDTEAYKDRTITEIHTKTTQIETKGSKTYSVAAIYFIMLTPFLPFLISWLSPAYAFSKKRQNIFGVDVYHIGLSVVAFGIFLILSKFFHNLFSTADQIEKDGFVQWLRQGLSDSLSIFSRDGDRQRNVVTTVDQSPAENRFEQLFDEVVGKFRDRQHDVVFVFDNIDRLPRTEIPKVWADIRLLFGRPNGQQKNQNSVLVMPFDRSHIDHVVKEDTDGRPSEFLNKMFDRILRVPTPVVTDIHGYFATNIQKAFRDTVPTNTVYQIYRIFDDRCNRRKQPPTPRNIVAFVNSMASSWAQWQGKIPLVSIALYCANREEIDDASDMLGSLRKMAVLAGAVDASDDWFRHAAALTFNVHPEHAYQVLLQPEILRGLASPTIDLLLRYQSTPGFEETFVRCVEANASNWAATEPLRLVRVTGYVGALQIGGSFKSSAWNLLGRASAENKAIALLPGVDLSALVELAESLSGPVLQRFLRSAVTWMTKCVNLEVEDQISQGELWCTWAGRLSNVLQPEIRSTFLTETVLPSAPDTMMGIAFKAEEGELNLSDLKIPHSDTDLALSLTTYMKGRRKSPHRVYMALKIWNAEEQRSQMLTAAINAMAAGSTEGQIADPGVLAIVADLIGRGPEADYAKLLLPHVSDGTVVLMAARSDDPAVSAASILLTALATKKIASQVSETHPTLGDLTPSILKYTASLKQIPARLDEFSSWIENRKAFSLWTNATIEHPSAFSVSVLQKLIERGKFDQMVVKEGAIQYPKIKALVGIELAAKFLVRYRDWNSHYKEEFEDDDILALSPEFLQDVSELDNWHTNWFVRRFEALANATSEEAWSQSFAEINNLLLLAISRRSGTKPRYITSKEFRRALVTYALNLWSGEVTSHSEELDWQSVVNLVPPKSKITLVNEILKSLPSRLPNQDDWDRFYDCYSRQLTHMDLGKVRSKAMSAILLPLLGSAVPETAFTLEQIADKLPAIVSSPTKIALQHLEKTKALLRKRKLPGDERKLRALKDMRRQETK
ncbi:P-loop NTPase fold protein [Devosia sp.]|uniref:P-loop NTPase fold protein n=1 Tax=Devosia sp. TaxID=1871048 RepID=UPI00262E4F1A|nr:P-loop NTPase fold protein [Devosia sp.]